MTNVIDLIGELRREAKHVNSQGLIKRECPDALLKMFETLVTVCYEEENSILDMQYRASISQSLAQCGIQSSDIEAFCADLEGNACLMYLIVQNALACVFEFDVGITRGPDEVRRRCEDLEFDDAGLLKGPEHNLRFHKDGVYYKEAYLIPYSGWILGTYNLGLSGGFTDSLTSNLQEFPSWVLKMSVSDDTVIMADRYRPLFTRAFIRGPQGVSVEQLRDPDFPEDPSGTVTVHSMVETNTLENLLFPVERLEVMWSERDEVKTVQIEELVSTENTQVRNTSGIHNRYVHSRWDIARECFTHVDGAIRSYNESEYQDRLEKHIKISDKPQGYLKLFRVDGEIPFQAWAELTTKWFYSNSLMLEYLEQRLTTEAQA